MDVVGYGVRIAVACDTWVLRFRGVGDSPAPRAGDGFFSSLQDGRGGVGNQTVIVEDGRVTLDPPGGGGLTLVADPGATHQEWRIEHAGWSCRWPAPLSIYADRPDAPWKAIEFHRKPDDVMIHVQGPVPEAHVPPPDGLVAPGQTMLDLQADRSQLWLEVGYVHDGTRWRQRHQYVPLGDGTIMLIRGQAPEGPHEAAWRAVDELARSFAPGRRGGQPADGRAGEQGPGQPGQPVGASPVQPTARRSWFGRRR